MKLRQKALRYSFRYAPRFFSLVIAVLIVILSTDAALRADVSKGLTGFGADGGPEATEPEQDNAPMILPEDDPATDPSLFEKRAEVLPERYLLRSIPWVEPNYSSQEGSLGWDPDLFKIPAELEWRVGFWKTIYSKYTTDQGVLHDIDDLRIVYEVIDFGSIMNQPKVSLSTKARLRTRLVNSRRLDISKRLERLSKLKSDKDVRDEADRKLLGFFLKSSVASLSKREFSDLRSRLQAASRKKRIRFQLGQKDKFILGIYYSGRYLKTMEEHFRAERLPIELTRLPFVESSFNIQARSRVGASGIWQFMRRTAKPWMMLNRDVDERNDRAIRI